MTEMPNRLIQVLLVVAMVISVGGTFVSMGRISQLRHPTPQPIQTGYAITQTGVANLSISSLLSIIIKNQTVDFGVCTPASGGLYVEVNTSYFELYNCSLVRGTGTGSTDVANKHLSVENDGNQDANVTIRTSAVASASFIGGTNPAFRYSTQNLTGYEGCFRNTKYAGTNPDGSVGGDIADADLPYINFTTTTNEHKGCDNLTWQYTTCDGSPQDRCAFKVEFSVGIPPNAAPGTYTADITFTANPE